MEKSFFIFSLIAMMTFSKTFASERPAIESAFLTTASAAQAYSGYQVYKLTSGAEILVSSKIARLATLAVGGTVRLTIATTAIAASFTGGYFFGELLIKGDKKYCNGYFYDKAGQALEPVFEQVERIQWLSNANFNK